MTTEQQISAIQDERDDARQDLRAALTLVNAKVGRAEDSLSPERIIEERSAGAALLAAAIGFSSRLDDQQQSRGTHHDRSSVRLRSLTSRGKGVENKFSVPPSFKGKGPGG